MFHVVIVEDEETERTLLVSYLEQFTRETGIQFNIEVYENAMNFLDDCKISPDLIFLDIQMPMMSGMEVAHRIRQKDANVLIVFVTNLAQYAIEGYEVGAFDFVLKPLKYAAFSAKMVRICNEFRHRNSDVKITLYLKEGIQKISIQDIYYFEVINHDVFIHTVDKVIKARSTLSAFTEQLADQYFALCNSCFLVNIRYVSKIDAQMVTVADTVLKISRSKRAEFLKEVAKYCARSV